MELSSAVERFNGYKAALADADLPFDASLVSEGDFWQPGGRKATLELLPAKPTAIFASNDLMALGAMEALRESGLRIPEDVSLIGFDDIPQMSIAHPKITTVHQPLNEMARTAVKLLLEQLENPETPTRRVTLDTTLVIRESTGPVPKR
jgi:LacI family transcriptional regulator